jgi:hypothetical protein
MQNTLPAVLATPNGSLNYVLDSGDKGSHDWVYWPRLTAISSLALRTAVEASAA